MPQHFNRAVRPSGTAVATWESIMQAEERRPRSKPNGPSRLMLRQPEAAEALGISEDSFVRYVAPEINMVRRGKLRLAPITELDRWIDENSVRVRGQG